MIDRGQMTSIYYDTEFIEDGRTIDLISIGMVAEDGRELYLITGSVTTFDRAFHHPWLREHVLPSLPVRENPNRVGEWTWDRAHPHIGNVRSRPAALAVEVKDFILATPDPQLWAWYAAYDHVALCQLWGRMIDLPKGVPMYTCDLKQECDRLGNPRMPEQESGEHNALADARHVKTMAEFLLSYCGERTP
jgi:hypothetical protein